jgi:glutamyl-tRNA synthetase|tara:strand:+ start:389 stop:2068 length:1680 start_codon:yes stop_codon:yes gene_type:complete
MEIKKIIVKYALQNAVKYNGKADVKAVIGKVLGENPKLRKKAKDIIKDINKEIKEINKLSLDKQKETLEKLAPEMLEKKKQEEKDMFAFLEIREGEEVRTAFPPDPSKYPHIGHAKAIFLNNGLAKKYDGSFVLRFEDTNPKIVEKEFYKVHLQDYAWLGIKIDKVEYASDFMDTFYEQAKKLIKKSHAYVCSCPQEEVKKNRFDGKECHCRLLMAQEQFKRFEEMFEAKKGEFILRLKGYMQHQNTVMRDPTLMRIIDEKHPRTGKKYRVWPTYDFENAVMDGVEKITHRLRSKEFEMRNELQRHIQAALGFRETKIYEFARFNLEGVESSGRIIREGIKKKQLIGWDDPSLTTIAALRRRGFLPEAIRNFIMSTGITKAESTLTWEDLVSNNRKLLDAKCNRYFFVGDLKEIKIEKAPVQILELKLHPDFKERGFRNFKTKDNFYINKDDFKEFKDNQLYRLMDCLNFKKKKGKLIFDSIEHTKYKKHGKKIIHWIPKEKDLVKTKILMPDKKIIKGLAEPAVKDLKINEVVQFQRFGFCRLDKKEKNKLMFWFTHK